MPYREQQNEAEIMGGIFIFIKIRKLLWYTPIHNYSKGATARKFCILTLFLTPPV